MAQAFLHNPSPLLPTRSAPRQAAWNAKPPHLAFEAFEGLAPEAESAAVPVAAQALAEQSVFDEITQGLLQQPATISPKFFYDQLGSELFESITRLPEYYPTRTEHAVMQQHAAEIAAAVGQGRTLIELGAGNCEKARALCRTLAPACFVGVDISADFLQGAVARMREEFPHMDVRAVGADMTRGVTLPANLPRTGRLVFYPGSSIGNFDPPHALMLLEQMRELVDGEGEPGADGGLLIGIDLPKEVEVLEAAYDDAAGVTAAFNLNVLTHVNRLIGSNFDPAQWRHLAFFNTLHSRIEMHLQAMSPLQVRWPGGGVRDFAAGECIHTENSYKYTLPAFTDLLARAGFSRARAWTDPRDWFAVVHAQP
nr:L-histidine N(alpha)-methyltransferase [Acidovorax soli]